MKLKLFEKKLEFWNLFENWSLKNYLKIGVLKIKFKNWNFGNKIWKKLEMTKIIWELEFWKLNLIIGVLEIKFERNWSFENYLKIGVLKIRFKNWNFGN